MFELPCAVLGFESAGWGEMLVLLVVILIVVGPKRLPEVARKLGRTMEMFRRAADEFKAQLMSMDQEPAPPPREDPSPYESYNNSTGSDGVPSAEASSGEAYGQPSHDSPYPGNEQYAEALNTQAPQADATPPAPEQPEAATETPTESAS